MLSVCPYFHVHQPMRIKRYRIFDIGNDNNYFNDESETDLNNKKVLAKVVQKSYLPTNLILLDLLKRHPEFRFALSFSGVVLEQLEKDFPEILDLFKELVYTGRVEILGDTYHHSLAFFYSPKEFERQVIQHRTTIQRLFGQTPTILRNTELSYNNDLAQWADKKGYAGIMAEGWDPILGWRSPNFVYRPKDCKNIKLLLKNYRLSDDIAFRFSEPSWEGWPLDAPTYAAWISSHHGNGQTVNLFMDYETFGEHQWEVTGIFNFLRQLPEEILKHPNNTFKTPSETIRDYDSVGEIDVPHILTWADTDRDLSAWTGNEIQQAAINDIYKLEDDVYKTKDAVLIEDWRKLQTSDHFYYMCTKWSADGDVHAYFNPYESPYEAYITFMNVLSDLKLRIQEKQKKASSGYLTRLISP
ncbi:polysaccharide deacetylase family protein [Patescibacteria group bacterium]|nr:polysaccharide deacetylase family protein [Patescibacteria group bacterium]